MRRSLLWALVCTVALSAIALIWPRTEAKLVAAVVRDASPSADRAVVAKASPPAEATPPLPADLEPIAVEPALRDPFSPVKPPAPNPPAPVPANPPMQPVMAASLEVPPQVPPTRARVLGTMVTPDGRRLVLMLVGDAVSVASAGLPLDNGYVVQAVEREAVRVVYPPTGTSVELALRDPAPDPR